MVSKTKKNSKFKPVPTNVDFIDIEHQMLDYWTKNDAFKKLVDKNIDEKSNKALIESYLKETVSTS